MYEKQDIEYMLKKYLLCKSQLEEIEFIIKDNMDLLEYNGKEYKENEEEAIAGMQLSAPIISDIPKSKTNRISDTTANVALNYNKEMKYINKIDIAKLNREIEDAKAKELRLRKIVGRVKRMLEALNREEKLIIETYYLYEQKWEYVASAYSDIYKQTRTSNQLRNIRDRAMEKMLQVVNIM